MVSLLFHGRQIGPICRRLASLSEGKIQAVSDRQLFPVQLNGTVIRWDSVKDVSADRTINGASAVRLSRNKKESRIRMGEIAPKTWTSWLRERKLFTYPCLVRGKRHYAAKKFYVCQHLGDVDKALRRLGYQRWYISPIIPKKLEYRVFVFQDHIVKVVRRYHDDPNQVAWNIANGGKSSRLKWDSWPIDVVKFAILAGRKLGLGWYAADVIVDKANSAPFVLELNTAPGLARDETFDSLVKLFSWAGENEPPELTNLDGTEWKDYVHPALRRLKKGKNGQPEQEGEQV